MEGKRVWQFLKLNSKIFLLFTKDKLTCTATVHSFHEINVASKDLDRQTIQIKCKIDQLTLPISFTFQFNNNVHTLLHSQYFCLKGTEG